MLGDDPTFLNVDYLTRGAWKTNRPGGDMGIDVEKIKLNLDTVRKAGAQQKV